MSSKSPLSSSPIDHQDLVQVSKCCQKQEKQEQNEQQVVGTVQIKSSCTHLLKENLGRISVLFSARLQEHCVRDVDDEDDVVGINTINKEFQVLAPNPISSDRTYSSDFLHRLQKYVDDICKEGCGGSLGGEDSSYDSDYEADNTSTTSKQHQDVSRTTSDTLAAEYADYVQNNDTSPAYTARVEFALKLGYTEKLVQAALQKLGQSPAQNELLAELIKLGAQRGIMSTDASPTTDGPSAPTTENPASESVNDSNQLPALKPIVIDGSNVAMSHGNKEVFSCRGIKICVEWFRTRGHKDITVFVPKWRKESSRPDNPVQDQEILAELERDRLLVFTPSRLVGGKRMVCYDDRYILKLAAEVDGIVVSNDNYRDLCQESAEFRKVVEERILMYSFVNDRFMPPDDPLGRSGPTLGNFLKTMPKKKSEPPPLCPYGKKCTYGNKCKYNHPERGPLPHKSVTERLSEHAQRHLQLREQQDVRKVPLGRTRSNVPPPKDALIAQHSQVSKSHSVDNVGVGYAMNQSENLHRKLQRQLTLNPNADPRLRRFKQQQQQAPNVQVAYSNWDFNHQNVTRIASAPDSYNQSSQSPWPNNGKSASSASSVSSAANATHHMQRMSSCSDPQLNVWSPQQQQQQQQQGYSSQQSGASMQVQQVHEDARRKLHYHLSAIFPEEQVAHAMRLFPDETNPQKICAAILNMFPNTHDYIR